FTNVEEEGDVLSDCRKPPWYFASLLNLDAGRLDDRPPLVVLDVAARAKWRGADADVRLCAMASRLGILAVLRLLVRRRINEASTPHSAVTLRSDRTARVAG